MISKEALENFDKLVAFASEPCSCTDDLYCRGCTAREKLENINIEIAGMLEEVESPRCRHSFDGGYCPKCGVHASFLQ